MLDLKACTVCFSTNRKLFQMKKGPLLRDFYSVSALKASDRQGMPQFLCFECTAYVRRFKKFRDKCHRANFALKEILKKESEIKIEHLESIDTETIELEPTLSYLNLRNTHYELVRFRWIKESRLGLSELDEIPVFHCGTIADVAAQTQVPSKENRLSNTLDVDSIKVEYNTSIEIEALLDSKDFDLEPSTSNALDSHENDFNYDNVDSDNNQDTEPFDNIVEKFVEKRVEKIVEKRENDVDGSSLDSEYATLVPISEKEAKAVIQVSRKCFEHRPFKCGVCQKGYLNEDRYKHHLRMHDKHTSGTFLCTLCHSYYKTEFLLKMHTTEKHMYKYLCTKCPEVSFDRPTAKKHYAATHLPKGLTKDQWYAKRPSWAGVRGSFNGKRKAKNSAELTEILAKFAVKKKARLPDDFLVYTPVRQEEQYELVKERQKTRNYMEAQFKCQLCFRGFREANTYAKHMKKHDTNVSGKFECDMCKLFFKTNRKLYKHMITTHLFKYSCRVCSYICYNRGLAQLHYKWHNNVTYPCPHCGKEFKKISTRLTHIRIKHPSTYICNLCGHSFVSPNGLYCHKKLTHTAQEMEESEATNSHTQGATHCAECDVSFVSEAAYKTHLGSSNKHATTNVSTKPVGLGKANNASNARKRRGRPRHASQVVNTGVPTASACEVCGKTLANDVAARRHYEAEHPGTEYLKRYMCDVCGHTTKQHANLMVHMRVHTNEKPYQCPHCDRRFSMPSNRDRHLVVHTGEKRYQCQHCSRRFTQSSAVKLHIQTVHLKIPYAPWDKKNRKRRKEMENAAAAPLPTLNATVLQPQPKLILDPQADYLNAYITYNE